MRRFIWLLCLVLGTGAAIWFFHDRIPFLSATSGHAQTAATDRVAKAERRDIESNIQVTGDVTPASQFDIKPEVGGKVKKIHVETGQTVKKGDLLVEIDDSDLLTEKSGAEAEIAGTRLSVEKNRGNYERARALSAAKLISQEIFLNLKADLDIAENTMLRAERRLESVEDRLRKTRIHAPSDGTILALNVLEGQVVIAAASVNSGTSLMTLADLSQLIVVTHVNQVDIASVRPNERATFRSEAIPGLKATSHVSFIAPVATVKNNVKGFAVEALIENADPQLRPGMTVIMSIPVASAHNVVSVPISAVFPGEDKTSVVYVRNGTSTETRKVQVGLTNLFYAEITSGLEPGEEILLVKPVLSAS